MLTLDKSGWLGDLDGWVTLTNNSGTAFKQARLQLVAGELRKVEGDVGRRDFAADARALSKAREKWCSRPSPSTTSTRWVVARRSTTPRPSSWPC